MDLGAAFETTFKLIFGECNLKLDELGPYLSRHHYSPIMRKSALSGKSVALTSDRYCKGAKFISQDEVDFGKGYSLNVNEIKDIDSIVGALSDRFYYTGNKIFGKSNDVQESDGCFDSVHVKDSVNVEASKYVAYGSYVRGGCEFSFGSSYQLASKYTIKFMTGSYSSRCFESYHTTNGSDLFFTYNCHGCSNVMFSFNLRSKKNCIGNLELPMDKYAELRRKLIGESREYLEKHREFYSILDYATPMKKLPAIKPIEERRGSDMGPIQTSFNSTCKVVFGTELGSIGDYAEYLNEGNPSIEKRRSVFGSTVYPARTFFYYLVPQTRLVSNPEANEAGEKLRISLDGNENLASLIKKLDAIAIYICEWNEGENRNTIESPVVYSATNVYRSNASFSKNVGYHVMAQHSESIFGGFRMLQSKFCIRCSHSARLVRCFEVSDSSDCTDSLFCHNCENLDNCMFCFNVKSKRYAIGNVEVGRENYMKVKKLVIDGIVARLRKDRALPLSIYNVACYKPASN
ncbi:Uncharacterised protein [uncultured archaeon]|nr:Uncharacterised protein [uncultured archaeon]